MALELIKLVGLPLGARIGFFADTERTIQQLKVTEGRLRNPRPMLRQYLNIMREGVREQFAQGGDPAWKELAPSTVAAKTEAGQPDDSKFKTGNYRKRRLMQNGAITGANKLIASGRLRDAWGTKNSPDHLESIDVRGGTVKIGVKPGRLGDIARWMQYGTKPYTIVPRSAKALAFMGAGGRTVLAKLVHHPGVPARPIRVTERTERQILEATQEYLRNDEMVGGTD